MMRGNQSSSSVGAVIVDFGRYLSQRVAFRRDDEDLPFLEYTQWLDLLGAFYLDNSEDYKKSIKAVHDKFSEDSRVAMGLDADAWDDLMRKAELRAIWSEFCRQGIIRKSDLPIEAIT